MQQKVIYYNASVILLPQGLKFSVTQLVFQVLIWRNLTIAYFTVINTLTKLAHVHWISGWYILVVKYLTKFLYNKENNNLESSILNTIKHLRNAARNMGISLEFWCFIYFNYFSSDKDKPYETICLWFSISLTTSEICIAQKYLLKIAILTL